MRSRGRRLIIGLTFVWGVLVAACTNGGVEPEAVDPGPSTSVAAETTVGPRPTTATAATTTIAQPTPTTTTLPPRAWDGYERLNILLLGSDAGVGRIGTRTDTMILLSIEPQSGDAAMFSIPRNLGETPLPDGMGIWDCGCFPDILTHLWANAEWYPYAFGGPQPPPVNALKGAVGSIFDIDVHFYAKVELAGFVALIDALGGLTIDVPRRIVDTAYPHEDGGSEYVVIEPGEQYLDGHLALVYARTRQQSGDFARMHRQRCILAALVDQIDPDDLAARLPELVAAATEHLDTDIPLDHLGDFVVLLSRVELDRLATLRITRFNYGTVAHSGYQLYDLERIRADARLLIDDPTVHLDTQDGEGWDDTCARSFD
jgi:LCP family protein required for cell wall assembly